MDTDTAYVMETSPSVSALFQVQETPPFWIPETFGETSIYFVVKKFKQPLTGLQLDILIAMQIQTNGFDQMKEPNKVWISNIYTKKILYNNSWNAQCTQKNIQQINVLNDLTLRIQTPP